MESRLQGSIASLRVEEISLGRTRGAKKLYSGLARAATSAKWRLPFTIRGVHVVLSEGVAQGGPKGRRKGRKTWDIPKLLTGFAAQLLMRLLPFLPIRIKDANILHKVSKS